MRVRCINPNMLAEAVAFKNGEGAEIISAIKQVGDDGIFPKFGVEYEVTGYWMSKFEDYEGYKLDGVDDPSAYGIHAIYFNKKNFEVVNTDFVPDHFHPEYGAGKTVECVFEYPKNDDDGLIELFIHENKT